MGGTFFAGMLGEGVVVVANGLSQNGSSSIFPEKINTSKNFSDAVKGYKVIHYLKQGKNGGETTISADQTFNFLF